MMTTHRAKTDQSGAQAHHTAASVTSGKGGTLLRRGIKMLDAGDEFSGIRAQAAKGRGTHLWIMHGLGERSTKADFPCSKRDHGR
ncbi:MAG TPA: hypothetical protein VE465_27460 [Streptosporangiaceae bacterium]|nr:hypothetical protein [Streptosporangiaceae bacterium]